MNRFLKLSFLLLVFTTRPCWSDVLSTPTPSKLSLLAKPTATEIPSFSLDDEKKRLEVERIQLENDRLKLEMEKLKYEATKTVQNSKTDEDRKKEKETFVAEVSKKAEALAKDNKEKDNVLVFDFVNSEVWYKAVRYSVHHWYELAEDQKWNMKRRLDRVNADGDERHRYTFRNVSLLRYYARPRGILTIEAPVTADDFHILTPEGISFDSTTGDIRNVYQSVYFKYNGEGHRDDLKLLRYKHNEDWLAFSDEMEFGFGKDGKIAEIRYGVLGEH
ncbi:MAG TPA: hypothetical protein VIJ93_10600 [bacterium]